METELACRIEALLKEARDSEEGWRRLREALHELAELRRHNHRAARLRRDQCLWEREDERQAEKERKQNLRDMCFAPMKNVAVAEGFGGGSYGEKMAEILHRINFDLPLDDLLDSKQAQTPHVAAKQNPAESNPIQAHRA
jgi:hypothetical protein